MGPTPIGLVSLFAACVFRKPPATTPHPTPCPPRIMELFPQPPGRLFPQERQREQENPQRTGGQREQRSLRRDRPVPRAPGSPPAWGGAGGSAWTPSVPLAHTSLPRCWPPSPPSSRPTSPWPSGAPVASLMQGPGQGAPVTAAA